MTDRLTSIAAVAPGVRLPGYDRQAHGVGIVHLGLGAFHRAHQAVYTDDALAASGGDWRIAGVSLRGTSVADALNPQHGLYTLIERSGEETQARIIGAIDRVIAATRDPGAVMAALTAPATRIVSLTVTEKAYGIDRTAGGADPAHSAVAADLADPRHPAGVLGLLVEALRLRRASGSAPFTVLCCDNLPANGALVRAGVTDFAARLDADLGAWVADTVAFPSTMVDRITPASTETTFADAARLTGCADLAAIETEPFSQWVIEDDFREGRPHWEAGGAIFVADVAPYEHMKLVMLNGAHSMLAYAGFLAGHRYVRDVMRDAAMSRLVARHLAAASATLGRLADIDLDAYAAALTARFSNPAIAHETYQIAMDGTEKLPQRLLAPALEALGSGQDIAPFAFAVAAWMRYCLGRKDDSTAYALRDPREAAIGSALASAGTDPSAIAGALMALPGVFPEALTADPRWRGAVVARLGAMLERGVAEALKHEAA